MSKTNTDPIVVVVNGYPTSGKDTFCNFAKKKYNTKNYSTVGTVKEIAEMMGWNGEKTPEARNMLSALKDFYVEWFDGTFNEITALVNLSAAVGDTQFIFLHTREPEEIERVAKWCNYNEYTFYSVFIERDVEREHGNHADANVARYDYDIYIGNYGSLEDFEKYSLDIFKRMVDNEL